MSSLRTSLKAALESAVVASGGAGVYRRGRAGRLLILAYHNILPTGSGTTGDRSLHLPQAAFAAQLDSLMETHRIVSLRDALTSPIDSDEHDARPRVAITFDDAYAGAVTAGVAELRMRELPATIFVTPTLLDRSRFWWDVLADPIHGLDEAFRRRALGLANGLTVKVLAMARESGLSETDMPPYACGASADQLRTATTYNGITLGAHTWSHPNLTSLADAELLEELKRPLAWLKSFSDCSLPMVSYPYGLADQRVMDATRDAGYSAGFMIDGGWTEREQPNRFAIPRLNVPAGVSLDGFVLRAAGLMQS